MGSESIIALELRVYGVGKSRKLLGVALELIEYLRSGSRLMECHDDTIVPE